MELIGALGDLRWVTFLAFRVTLGEMDLQDCVLDKVLLKVKFLVWLLQSVLFV